MTNKHMQWLKHMAINGHFSDVPGLSVDPEGDWNFTIFVYLAALLDWESFTGSHYFFIH